LEVNLAFGILARRGLTNDAGIAGRGRVDEDHGSVGPGTKIKWEWVARRGKARMSSFRALNPAAGTVHIS
jgi:hypothetical protein